MMPRKVILRRERSNLARHTVETPFPCNGPLRLRIEPSHRRQYEALVVEHCGACGRVVKVLGVIESEEARNG